MTSDNQRMREFHLRLLEQNGGEWFDFEPHLAAFYCAFLHPGSIAVDGGANMGLHTFQMAHAVYPGGTVVAIEPLPEMQQLLRTREQEYRLPENFLRLMPCGLFSTAGEADFYQVLHSIHHEMSGLRNRRLREDHPVKQIRVELTTLDSVCRDLNRLDFVKLDLEGAEMDALRGGRATLERFRPIVAIEQDQYSPQYFGYTWDNLLEYFASLQYEIYDLFGLRYTEAEMFHLCAVWDFVALPAEYPNRQHLFDAVRRSMDAIPAAPAGRLARSSMKSACVLDFIGEVRDPVEQKSVQVSGSTGILFSGWAVDEHNATAAEGVDIVIDDVPYGTVHGRYRGDVALHFHNIACQPSGFQLTLPPGTLSKGRHTASVRIICGDKKSYHQGPTVKFTVA